MAYVKQNFKDQTILYAESLNKMDDELLKKASVFIGSAPPSDDLVKDGDMWYSKINGKISSLSVRKDGSWNDVPIVPSFTESQYGDVLSPSPSGLVWVENTEIPLQDGKNGTSLRQNSATAEEDAGYTLGNNATALGDNTKSPGDNAFSEGQNTTALGLNSHAEGSNTQAKAVDSHAEGSGTIAAVANQHVQGKYNVEDTEGKYTHIVGNGTEGTPANIHTLDQSGNAWFKGDVLVGGTDQDDPTAISLKKLSEGGGTSDLPLKAAGPDGTAISMTNANVGSWAYRSFAGGNHSSTNAADSFAFGDGCNASGFASVALGDNAHAPGESSFAQGYSVNAEGKSSHCEGVNTQTLGEASHCEGANNYISETGKWSHCEGTSGYILAPGCHVEGSGNVAGRAFQHIEGTWNLSEEADINNPEKKGKYVHIVGNGTDRNTPSNAHTLDWNGNGWFANDVLIGGANQDDPAAISLKKLAQSGGGGGSSQFLNLENGLGRYSLQMLECQARDSNSIALGDHTIASSRGQLAIGKYNVEDKEQKYSFIIGSNLIPVELRYNIFTVDWFGNVNILGNLESYQGDIVAYDEDSPKGTRQTISLNALNKQVKALIGGGLPNPPFVPSYASGAAEMYAGSNAARGERSFALGYKCEADGTNSVAQGFLCKAISNHAHAEGANSRADGNSSHAEGSHTVAKGSGSHAEGGHTIASAEYSHAEGRLNIEDTEGKYVHIIGNGTFRNEGNILSNAHTLDWNGNAWFAGDILIGGSGQDDPNVISLKKVAAAAAGGGGGGGAIFTLGIENGSGINSIRMKSDCIASGNQSFAIGTGTKSVGTSSYCEGTYTIANGESSHCEGYFTIANGEYSHVQGKWNAEDTANKYAHIVGNGAGELERLNIHTLDWNGNGWFKNDVLIGGFHQDDKYYTISMKKINETVQQLKTNFLDNPLPLKRGTDPSGYAVVQMDECIATRWGAFAEGTETSAEAYQSHAEGYLTHSLGHAAHAEGNSTRAEGSYCHAEGFKTQAKGKSSHSEGEETIAEGDYSHAEGRYAHALGDYSHTEGNACRASKRYSHAEGNYTLASSESQHTQGKYNIEDTEGKYAHIVGNGNEYNGTHSNAHTLDWNGNGWFAKNVLAGGTNQDDASNSDLNRIDAQITYSAMKNNSLISQDKNTILIPKLRRWFKDTIWTAEMVHEAVATGLITEGEYNSIIQ